MIQKNIKISAGLIIAAFVLRLTQLFTVIDYKTGFYKRDYGVWGLILTVLVFVLCVVAAIFSHKSLHINKFKTVKAMPIISALVSASLMYEFFAEKFTIQGVAWQVILMKVCGLAAALYFMVLVVSDLIKFEIPDVMHTIPTFYVVIRIVCSFINISSLSLIAENIFFIAALCCTLLFFVSYAAFYCLDDHDKTLNLRTVLACSLCYVTAASNIVANIFVDNGYNHIPFYSQSVLMMLSLFIAAFAFNGIFETRE